MMSQWHYLDMLQVPIDILRVNILLMIFLLNILFNISAILALNHHIIYFSIPLIVKSATHLLTNTRLLFSHIPINIHLILPPSHHWVNLATNTLSLPCLHTTNHSTILPTHLPFSIFTHLLHTSNPMTKCLFSLRTCINFLTEILHLPHWVNIPTNILSTTKLLTNTFPYKTSLHSTTYP